jgi:phage-related holin
MNKQDLIRKLTSRKFWAAVVSFVTMLIVALGVAEDTATQVGSIIMAGATMMAYIIGEGLVDASSATEKTENKTDTDDNF